MKGCLEGSVLLTTSQIKFPLSFLSSLKKEPYLLFKRRRIIVTICDNELQHSSKPEYCDITLSTIKPSNSSPELVLPVKLSLFENHNERIDAQDRTRRHLSSTK